MIQKLKEAIVMAASYYRQTISEPVLEMYCEDLVDLPVEAVIEAYRTYRRDPKNKTFPLPAQIREIISPTPNPEALAREIVDRIKIAIKEHGWAATRSAREAVGPEGWVVISGMGGWSAVCESDFIYNPGLQAQARNRALDIVTYGTDRLATGLLERQERREIEFQTINLFHHLYNSYRSL